jgi:hypothetical protein
LNGGRIERDNLVGPLPWEGMAHIGNSKGIRPVCDRLINIAGVTPLHVEFLKGVPTKHTVAEAVV